MNSWWGSYISHRYILFLLVRQCLWYCAFNHCWLSQIQKKIDEMAALGLDTTALDDEVFNMEAALDRCILRLISSCCNGIKAWTNLNSWITAKWFSLKLLCLCSCFSKGDKLVRATELAKLLTMEKSMKGALTLVTRLKLPILQEKFSSILEVKATPLNFLPWIEPSYFRQSFMCTFVMI